jgi:hypothetical protein
MYGKNIVYIRLGTVLGLCYDRMPKIINLKRRKIFFAPVFRGFHPWRLGFVVLSLW